MNTELLAGETIIKEGKANHQRGIETVGGKLYLSNQRLVFESHSLNIQTGATIISLNDIVGAEKCWTKFLNLIPLAPNSIAVKLKTGEEHRFVVFGREAWISAIQANSKERK